ncbi:ATP-binding cassette domain-containing protein [Streptomyces cocklensis]|uniref:Peptide/nickel transport system ATP-binding protein n=1 Tax=Actinacidiphila cocklensis TaxID=887465 RepID=A0A9W4GN07_9ACTN|nr:ABC transporter ATP-binding protein [Actinacidiphila cocklensis]MDD1058639.1 ATP-binding cassette domain-containing protein [Actinacidiphila cocklensis]CAG6390821.1 Peptide/nickel transport system ATP-binding protein [Actinacidiphila cocklensis]
MTEPITDPTSDPTSDPTTAPRPTASAARTDAEPLLALEEVGKRYRPGVLALDRVTLRVPPGRTTGLVGESGSGKSTLARLALGLLAPDGGTVRFDGHDPYRLRGRSGRAVRAGLQFVPQHPGRSLNPALRAGTAVALALAAHGTPRRERRDAVAALFCQVGLDPALARRYPRELSGGQLQRIAVARALATRPRLLVCDEPTSALDRRTQTQVLDLLVGLQAESGLGFLFISHDLAVVRELADRVTVLRQGRVVEEGATGELWDAPRHPYTRALLAAAHNAGTTPTT